MSYDTDKCRCNHPRVAHFKAGNCSQCECGYFQTRIPHVMRCTASIPNLALTAGKDYEILQNYGYYVEFRNDNGDTYWAMKANFSELPQTGVEKMPAPVPEATQGAQSNANGAGFALPTDPKARKDIPMVRGLLDYFPAALAAVAELSRIGNEQHNPGQEMHHVRGKSTDHADCIVRHLMDRDSVDTDGVRHATKVAWRALALLQLELEAAGAKKARAAK